MPARVACDQVERAGKNVNDFAFAFIAPLGAEDDCGVCVHGAHFVKFGPGGHGDDNPDVLYARLSRRLLSTTEIELAAMAAAAAMGLSRTPKCG